MIVGLTGGIGSGKTTVARMFQDIGVSIYITDVEAKKLMLNSKVIRKKLIALFGVNVYKKHQLNRALIRKQVFKNNALLNQLNAIVHPKVGMHFKKWAKKQKAPYVIKESAILFKSGAYASCDIIITVTAKKTLRIERVLKRDKLSKPQIKAIINNQMKDKERKKRSDYVITNNHLEDTKLQVEKIHQKILKFIK